MNFNQTCWGKNQHFGHILIQQNTKIISFQSYQCHQHKHLFKHYSLKLGKYKQVNYHYINLKRSKSINHLYSNHHHHSQIARNEFLSKQSSWIHTLENFQSKEESNIHESPLYCENDSPLFHLHSYRKWYFEHFILNKYLGVNHINVFIENTFHLKNNIYLNEKNQEINNQENNNQENKEENEERNQKELNSFWYKISFHTLNRLRLEKKDFIHINDSNNTQSYIEIGSNINAKFFIETYESELEMLIDIYPELEDTWINNAPLSFLGSKDWIKYAPKIKHRVETLLGIHAHHLNSWYNVSRMSLKECGCHYLLSIMNRIKILKLWYPGSEWHIDSFIDQKSSIIKWLEELSTELLSPNYSIFNVENNIIQFKLNTLNENSIENSTKNSKDLIITFIYCDRLSFENNIQQLMNQKYNQDYFFWDASHLKAFLKPTIKQQLKEFHNTKTIIIPFYWNYTIQQLYEILNFNLVSLLKIVKRLEHTNIQNQFNQSTQFTQSNNSLTFKTDHWTKFYLPTNGIRISFHLDHKIFKLNTEIEINIPSQLKIILVQIFEYLALSQIELYITFKNKANHYQNAHTVLFGSKPMKWWIHEVCIILLDTNDTSSPFWMRQEDLRTLKERIFNLLSKYDISQNFIYFPEDFNENLKLDNIRMLNQGRRVIQYHPNSYLLNHMNELFSSSYFENYRIPVKIISYHNQIINNHLPHSNQNIILITCELPFGAIIDIQTMEKYPALTNSPKIGEITELELLKHQNGNYYAIASHTIEKTWNNLQEELLSLLIQKIAMKEVLDPHLQQFYYDIIRNRTLMLSKICEKSPKSIESNQVNSLLCLLLAQNQFDLYPSEKDILLISTLVNISPSNIKIRLKELRRRIRKISSNENIITSNQKQKIKLKEIPNKITPQAREVVKKFIKSNSIVSKSNFQLLKYQTNLTSKQISKLIKNLSEDKSKITDVKESMMENWVLNHLQKPNASDVAFLSKEINTSQSQISRKMDHLINYQPSMIHTEIRRYLLEWLENNNYQIPTNEQYEELMKETSLSREQLRKKLTYLVQKYPKSTLHSVSTNSIEQKA